MTRVTPIAVILLLPVTVAATENSSQYAIGHDNAASLRNLFGTYGSSPTQRVLVDRAGGLRFWLPGHAAGTVPMGVYSYFHLSGDCTASLIYDLVSVHSSANGPGRGIGLAFDLGETIGRGILQRINRSVRDTGYLIQTQVNEGGRTGEENRFVASGARRGRIGLRRRGKNLQFLAADDPSEELRMIWELPFPNTTVRTVRIFAEHGSSPGVLDVRVRGVQVRGEEFTAGVPRRESQRSWRWLWVLTGIPPVGLLLWWRMSRRTTV